jgi:hypothetical protein
MLPATPPPAGPDDEYIPLKEKKKMMNILPIGFSIFL